MARLYLILSLMSPPEDWARSESILRSMPEPVPGTSHDLYLVARAKGLRHHHDPDAAYDLLRPLVGKMVDGTARGLLEEEVSRDALEANRAYEAIAYMDAWIRGANEESRGGVKLAIAKILTTLPEQALMGSLRGMRATGAASGYGQEIQRLVARQLADVALERGDPSLARWLLDPDAGASPGIEGDAGVQLGELATSKRGLGNVTGRTLGLVLPTGTTDLRHAAADVARGVAWALELPRVDPQAGDAVRLVTRDDTGEPERLIASLEEVAGEGASIILTGLDSGSADRAIDWAESKKIALVVLASPEAAKPGRFSFMLGQPIEPVIRALAQAVSKGPAHGRVVATVVEGNALAAFTHGFNPSPPEDDSGPGAPPPLQWRAPVACDVQALAAGEPRFPVVSWAAAGVRAWVLATGAECAADVIHELGARAAGGTIALTLETAGVAVKPAPGVRFITAAAGIMPLGAGAPDDYREIEARRMASQLGGHASWWAALGRDAGALARKALASLPTDTVTLAPDIAKRHEDARDALRTARVGLWTTDAPGFVGAGSSVQLMPRDIRVFEVR
jgi:hypothetical protein